MIKLNFRNGSTLEFDLNDEDDRQHWDEWSPENDFQEGITAIGIIHQKKFHTLPCPKGFRKAKFNAELVYNEKKGQRKLIGEKVSIHVDNILLELLVYTYTRPQPPPVSTRITLKRIGKQRGPYMN